MKQVTGVCILLMVIGLSVQLCRGSVTCTVPVSPGLVAECFSPDGQKIDCLRDVIPETILELSCTHQDKDTPVERTRQKCSEEGLWTGELLFCPPDAPIPGPSNEEATKFSQTDLDRALVRASQSGNLEEVKSLLERGADPKYTKNPLGYTALHWASSLDQLEMVRVLLDNGAPVKAKAWLGMTPLHLAAFDGSVEVASLLLQRGANLQSKNIMGEQPIHLASYRGHVDMVRLLLDSGASLEDRGRYGGTAIWWAAYANQVDLIRFLLERGASPDSRDNRGITPAEVALEEKNEEAYRLLLKEG